MRVRDTNIKARLIKFQHIDPETSCWRFSGYKSHDGYGIIQVDGKPIRAHRLSASLFLNFDLNSDLQVNHKKECKYRDCFNPDHLYIGTHQDNMQDRRDENFFMCGHERSIHNTWVSLNMDGYVRKECKECRDNYQRRRNA